MFARRLPSDQPQRPTYRTLCGFDVGTRRRLLGDGLVPLASALGRHRDPRLTLGFPESHQWIARRTGHFDLLDHPEVWRRIRAWLAD